MRKNGVSLVALVITIIVLIILTTAVILLAGGENGIVQRARTAVEASNKATAMEKVLLEISRIKMEAVPNGQNVYEYLYDAENGTERRQELEEKEIRIKEVIGTEITFLIGDYEVITDFNGNIKSTEKSTPTEPEIIIPIVIGQVSITTDGSTVPGDGTLNYGTPVQVDFNPTVEGGTVISVNPTLPYTTNGTDKEITFIITGTYEGEEFTKTQTVDISSKYRALEATANGYDAIGVGDFINYDAGTWTQSEINALKAAELYDPDNNNGALPTYSKPYKFGGFKAGDSRNNCIIPGNIYSHGWIVVKKDNVNRTIVIAHAGTPEAYYHPNISSNSGYMSEYILSGGTKSLSFSAGLTPRSMTMYENEYAVENSAHLCTNDEANDLIPLDYIVTGVDYWLASEYGSYNLQVVTSDGTRMSNYNYPFGVRPILTLKSDVQVAGYVGQSTHKTPDTAWEIVN